MQHKFKSDPFGDFVHQADIPRFEIGSDQDLEHELCDYGSSTYRLTRRSGRTGSMKGSIPYFKTIAFVTEDHLPHYLFRVTHSSSAGTNNEGLYQSGTVASGLGKSNFFTSTHDNKFIRETLRDHLNNKKTSSHWISFTDSLPSAIARALKFKQKGYPVRPPTVKSSDIRFHIVDTFKIRKEALIVHGFAMARGYKVFDRAKSILKRMVLGSLRGKFLVWNELDVEASSVSLESLLRLSRGGNHLNTTGILELMPFLQKAPGNTLKKKNKPDPETGREFEVKRQFRAAWQLTKQLYGIEMVIEFRKQLYRPMAPKKTREQDRAGRMRRKIWFVERETADQRCELEPGKLVAFQNLVAGFKPEFQELWAATTNTDSKLLVDIATFEKLYAKCVKKLVGEYAVYEGGLANAGRAIIRLDSKQDTTLDVPGEPSLLQIREDAPLFEQLEREQQELEAYAQRYKGSQLETGRSADASRPVDPEDNAERLLEVHNTLYGGRRKRKNSENGTDGEHRGSSLAEDTNKRKRLRNSHATYVMGS
ncbi:uncharacterized protein HMPREF1541_04518 [Cyphellophora europaea CBS 101466]|uniref:DUF7587 domain-containing protein n=1 Tax=Cyphellophora europaea (strain CBS 101466) TaxID=1220924 RepID=W2RUX2_CYPE1|nr:uncharacterized protein HMPREF1541_04518 [Cyphellophora europaea CBS 101466]ETN40242.1 hypothetical protein HMPREF1541_04518 [Cyphellophora europaea CBS 101466]